MKNLFLLLLAFSFSFLISCDSEIYELEPQTIETFKNNEVLFVGEVNEVSQSKIAEGSSERFGCRVTPPPPSTCGIDVCIINELNLLGDENLVFYAMTNTSPGWTITSSLFRVTYQDGHISNHTGYTNPIGYPQIIIPVSCSNKVTKVEARVFGTNSSNTNCSDTRIDDWGPFGVCGTGGFN